MNKILVGLYTGDRVPDTMTPNVVNIIYDLIKNDQLAGWNSSRPGAVGFAHASSCRVDANRNKLIAEFVKHPEATHLFILDADMVHPPEMPRLLASRNLPIVTGTYFARDTSGEREHPPQLYHLEGQTPDTRPGYGKDVNNVYRMMVQEASEFYGSLPGIPYQNGPLILTNEDGSLMGKSVIPIDAAGFGCVCISREAAEAIDPPWLQDEPGLNGDLAFYKKAATYGIQAYGDLSMIATHIQIQAIGIAAFCDFVNNNATN